MIRAIMKKEGDTMNDDVKDVGLHLLTKGKQSVFKIIFSRTGLIVLLLVIQVLFLLAIFGMFEEFIPHIYGAVILFTLFMILYLLNSSIDASAKITWLVIVMFIPIFGVLLFLYTQQEVGHRTLKKRMDQVLKDQQATLPQEQAVMKELEEVHPALVSLTRFLSRSGAHPVWKNTNVSYFPLGEIMFEEMLVQLKKAKHFIFLEYFIVAEGKMWGEMLEILAQKVKEGVEVRFLYDGTNEFTTLPHDYPKRLRALGIQAKMFAPVTPFVSTHYNYRDHRKILVIDGTVAFNGGINLADEYINEVVHYGHWKDTGVMLEGDGVKNFTMMFLQMWNLDEKNKVYKPYVDIACGKVDKASGYVLPYGDCPLGDDQVGEHVYMDLLYRAKKYAYITSPYLIVDGEMEDALIYAAKRGVDVQLMLPGISDSTIAHGLAYTHYHKLLQAGVKILEYDPGYVHAKMFIVDGKEAVVGTINLDYRSLYHHFECATYLYDVACIKDILLDFMETKKKCTQITLENVKKLPLKRKLVGFVMKTIAPLI